MKYYKLQNEIGGRLDYSISAVPDRGEFIRFSDYDHEALCRLSGEDCPLTGCFWDIDIIQGLRSGEPERVLKALHSNTEYLYSNEGLTDFIEENGYEFFEEGRIALQ